VPLLEHYLLSLTLYLVSEPNPSHREEGSGHPSTFELSPGMNADLTNVVMEMVFSRLSVSPVTMANRHAMPCYSQEFVKS